jgi:pimeloyl-ACP methyl ester carboxylesterase
MDGRVSDVLREPALAVAAIEARAITCETRCGTRRMVWRRWGQGSPVVLLHGGAGAWSHWIRNIMPLAASHGVWVPDMLGFGDSDAPEVQTVDAISDALQRGVAELIPSEPLDIAGFSFGAAMAAVLGAHLAGRLRNVAMLGPRFTHFAQRRNLPLIKWRQIEDPVERLAAHRTNLEMMMVADPKNADALAVYLQSTNAERTSVVPRRWKPGPGEKLHEALPHLRPQGRMTVILGARDEGAQSIVTDPEAARQAIYPDARFHIIENAGHWVQYEAAEQVNAILLKEFAG